jgi:diacylglycerol O-acyltransferase / wax synthase
MTSPNHERMSSVDTAWLRMDSPENAMMIVGVTVTATPLSLADFRRMLETRFLCFPRFRLRPVQDPFGASWLEDESFDLDAHLLRVKLPAPGGKAELQSLAAELAGRPLNPDRPWWQVHLIEDYLGGSAWVLRIHHCYADGIAMVRVLLSMTEQDSGPALAAAKGGGRRGRKATADTRPRADLLPLLNWVDQLSRPANDILESVLAEGAKLLEGGIHKLFHPDQAAAMARQAGSLIGEFARVLALPDDPQTPLRGALSGTKHVAWADPIPLAEVKAIGRALDCTVNDVLMATVAGALGAHLRDRDFDTESLAIRASMPVNLRAAEEPLTLGNKFGLIFVELPIGIRNPLQRVYAMHDTMVSLKGSLQPPMSLMVLGLMGLLPAAVQAPAIELFSRKGSLVASNVPGPQAPLYMCGQRISEMYFWVPQSGTMGIGISILSYAGQVFFGIIADDRLIDDPQAVVDRIGPEFERLLLAVTVGTLAGKQRTSPVSTGEVGAKRRVRVRKKPSPQPSPASGRGSRVPSPQPSPDKRGRGGRKLRRST